MKFRQVILKRKDENKYYSGIYSQKFRLLEMFILFLICQKSRYKKDAMNKLLAEQPSITRTLEKKVAT